MKSLSPASLAPASLSPLSSSSSRSVSSLGTSAAPAPPAMPRKASSTPDSRLKWRKRKRKRIPDASASPLRAADHSEDSDSAAANDDDDMAVPSAAVDAAADEILAGAAARDPAPDLREAEVLSSAEIISAFPAATRRKVNRPHPSVLAVVAAERSAYVGDVSASVPPALENISHGQLQVLSGALPDHPSLSSNPDRPSSYVCTPPPLMEGHGVLKQFQGRLHVVPKHSDWFSPGTVHRLERQVVPHFFTGKSPGNTPEKFMMLRNKVIAKYLGNPGKRLAFAECQGLVVNTGELYDLSRIVRFLDAWGVINYLAVGLVHRGLRLAPSLLREEPAGELQLLTAPLKSIDGLILFDRPKCSLRAEDIALLASSPSNPEVVGFDAGAEFAELEGKIRERLSESSCSYCSQSLRSLHYQSQKEVDIALCSSCFHDSRYITGHSSLDFQRANGDRNGSENDGDNWTDQETLLLLEGIEKHNDNWNSIADHVGTKSKAQCIYHFIRLPVEDSLLENIEVPDASMPFRAQTNGHPHSDSNGNLPQSIQHGNQLPFISSSNPVMSLVAFLASAIGPRIAASCASAALSALTRDDDPRVISESMHADDRTHGAHPKFRDHNGASSSSISPENVKHAALWGLSAAAMKSKLFADQEEREIQRLSATVINHQLKRLELKLKQFAEVETLLLKECEQVERARQRISAGRMQVMSGRLSPAGTSRPNGGSSTIASNPINMSPRPVAAPGSMAEATIPAASANNMDGQGHPQMPFLQRQPQMLSFGPRLPLSAIQTQPSAQGSNIMFSSAAMPNSVTPSHNHQLLRSSSGNNSSLG